MMKRENDYNSNRLGFDLRENEFERGLFIQEWHCNYLLTEIDRTTDVMTHGWMFTVIYEVLAPFSVAAAGVVVVFLHRVFCSLFIPSCFSISDSNFLGQCVL